MPKTSLLFLLLLFWVKTAAQNLQLAPPQTASSRLFAEPNLRISFDFRLQGAEIRYTTDGNEPTATSNIFATPLKVNGPAIFKAKSYKTGFLPSEATTVQVLPYKSHAFDSVGITPAPKKYEANGWKTLSDKHLGDANFQQNWLGFDSTEIELNLLFSKKRPVSNIVIGFLRQQKAWIFLPATIEIYDEKGKLLANQSLPDEGKVLPDNPEIFSFKIPKRRHKFLIIKILALPQLPAWHPGSGSKGWIFLDEIMAW